MGLFSRGRIEKIPSKNQEGPKIRAVTKEEIEGLNRAASLCIKTLGEICNVKLEYDMKSIKNLDSIIEENWSRGEPEGATLFIMAAFLGEAMNRLCDCSWVYDEGDQQFAIKTRSGSVAYPYRKVYKRFVNGDIDSITFFVQAFDKEINK